MWNILETLNRCLLKWLEILCANNEGLLTGVQDNQIIGRQSSSRMVTVLKSYKFSLLKMCIGNKSELCITFEMAYVP
jgi:hypothetical protein